MKTVETDRIVIIGAGLAALYAALALAPLPVVIISPEALGEGASSAWAQGGVAAAMAETDSPQAHAKDTIRAGAGIVDSEVAKVVTQLARSHIFELTERGAPFDRTPDGDYILSREAAHDFARIVRVKGDQAGAAIMAALIRQVQNSDAIQVLEHTMALGLAVSQDTITGVEIQSSGPERSAPVCLRGAAYLLGGGGSGGLFAVTTNPPRICGQVIGMAARAGAAIADAEFVQFHPTAMDVGEDPAPLATEALRGEGATLINAEGERFMLALHLDAELAPRDVVARAVYQQTQAGKRPMLDTRQAVGAQISERFPAVAQACARNGIDPAIDPIPVAAAAHYHMGGIATDAQGRSSLGNLWVCGEASATGLHGANRLASNGLLEALVYARICADAIADVAKATTAAPVEITFEPGGKCPAANAVRALRRTMTDNVGVVRTNSGLLKALQDIAALEMAQTDVPDFINMCATATLIAAGALTREESRGAHARADFPDLYPGVGQRSLTTLRAARAVRTLACEETS